MSLEQTSRLILSIVTVLGMAALAATKASGPVQPKNVPQWLAQKSVALAGQCRYPSGNWGNDVGKDPKTNDGNCANNCATSLAISPISPSVKVNTPIQLNFRTQMILGGPNTVCASEGTVDWGDGQPPQGMPSDPWSACGKQTSIIHNTVGKPVDVNLVHAFPTAGTYCVSASVTGNHKYDGDGSCSYDCTVSTRAYVTVTP